MRGRLAEEFGGRENGDGEEKMILVASDTSRDAPHFDFTNTGVYREGENLRISVVAVAAVSASV